MQLTVEQARTLLEDDEAGYGPWSSQEEFVAWVRAAKDERDEQHLQAQLGLSRLIAQWIGRGDDRGTA